MSTRKIFKKGRAYNTGHLEYTFIGLFPGHSKKLKAKWNSLDYNNKRLPLQVDSTLARIILGKSRVK